MITSSRRSIPRSVESVRRRFERWRTRGRPHGRSAIPPALWAAAVGLARQHGLYHTSRTLHLDYTALKKHLAAEAGHAVAAPPTFVELVGPRAPAECVLEVDGPRATVRLRVAGLALTDLARLTRTLAGAEA